MNPLRFYWRTLRWPFIVLGVVFIVSAVPMLRGNVVRWAGPFIMSVRHIGEAGLQKFSIVGSIGTLVKENGQLRADLAQHQATSITNAELRHENDILRQELSLARGSLDRELLAAQVISRTSSVTQQSILINKGSADGFKNGMAAVAQGFYIGRIEDVQTHTSRVLLVTSARSLLPVVLQTSRAVGLLRGGAEGLILDEIPRDVTINLDEAIVTAPLGDTAVSGLPIGVVSRFLSSKSDVFQSTLVTTPIDLSRLEIVFGVR